MIIRAQLRERRKKDVVARNRTQKAMTTGSLESCARPQQQLYNVIPLRHGVVAVKDTNNHSIDPKLNPARTWQKVTPSRESNAKRATTIGSLRELTPITTQLYNVIPLRHGVVAVDPRNHYKIYLNR